MSISAVQNEMLARAEAVLGNKLHYEALPATADLDAQLAARAKRLPAVFVAFLGGPAIDATCAQIDAEFAALVITAGVSEATRRGGAGGAVPILEQLVPALHGHMVPGIGSLTLASVNNLFAQALDEKGLSLYAASYRIKLVMTLADDPQAHIAPFVTFHADWQVNPTVPVDPSTALPLAAGQANAESVVTYPQGESS